MKNDSPGKKIAQALKDHDIRISRLETNLKLDEQSAEREGRRTILYALGRCARKITQNKQEFFAVDYKFYLELCKEFIE